MSERATAVHGRGLQGRGKEQGEPLGDDSDDGYDDYETPESVLSEYNGMPFEDTGSMSRSGPSERHLGGAPPVALNNAETLKPQKMML